MKKFLIAILIILSTALLFGCNNKNATLESAQKVGTKGNFDVYKLTYSNGFETLVEIGDNTVIENVEVMDGFLRYVYKANTSEEEIPYKDFIKDEKEKDNTENGGISSDIVIKDFTSSLDGSIIQLIPVDKDKYVYTYGVTSIILGAFIPACEHSFGEYTHLTDATCSAYGQDVATCSKCDCTLTYCTAKLEHEYDTETIHTVEPTCTKEGYEYYKCKNCNDRKKIYNFRTIDEHEFYGGVCKYCKTPDPNFKKEEY